MISFILQILLISLGVFYFHPYITNFSVSSLQAVFFFGGAMALTNLIIKPVVKFITFPIRILTLGLFTIVINLALVYLVALVVPGVQLSTFLAVIIVSVLVAIAYGLSEGVSG